MRRTARLKALARRADPRGRATYDADASPHENTDLRASDPAAPSRLALGGRGLDSRRMSYSSGRPGDVNRCERRRTDQADDEREWEKAFTGEIHGCGGLLTGPGAE
jgi:hypothetical protein